MTAILTNPRERSRFLRFAVVGAIGAVVDFGVADILTHFFQVPLVIAGTISFVCAVISNFLWNRYWTYPDSRSKTIARQFFEFMVVSLVGLGIRIPLLAILEEPMFRIVSGLPFQLPFFSPRFISDNLTLAVAVVVVMFWNFFINRYWTYSDVE